VCVLHSFRWDLLQDRSLPQPEAECGARLIENGVEHLANAVAVTAHNESLIDALRSNLPVPIFKLLILRLPKVNQKLNKSTKIEAVSP
jgi:hypothetical protein